MHLNRYLLLSAVLLTAGCGGEDVRVYRIAKSGEAASQLPAGHPPMGSPPPMGGAPELPDGHPPTGSTPPMGAPAAASQGPIRWDVPKGWEVRPAGGMRKGSYTVRAGGAEADVSVISLPGAAGGLLPNVNRWRGQVGLGQIDMPTLRGEAEAIETSAGEILVVDIKGGGERIVGGILDHDGQSWFFKMKGGEKPVGAAKPAFLAMIKSIDHAH